jgi:hypothetical protein
MNPVVHCLAGPLLAAWSNCLDGLQQRLDHHVEVLESKEHPYIYVTAVGVIVGEVVLKALWSMHSQKAMHTTGAHANEQRKSSTVADL